MKFILGLIGLIFGISILVGQSSHFGLFPFVIGLVFTVIGWKLLTGKIKV
jgi:hypothetical protein